MANSEPTSTAKAIINALLLNKSTTQLAASVTMLGIGTLGQILLSVNADKLADLDRGIAAWARSL